MRHASAVSHARESAAQVVETRQARFSVWVSEIDFQYQFQCHRANAVSQKTELSFADYKFMHTTKREGLQRANPHAWAADDNRLREVLMIYLWRRLMLPRRKCPQNIAEVDFAAFGRRIDRKSRALVAHYRRSGLWVRKQRKEFASYEAIAKYGASKITALIAWRVFRLGYDSIQATENLPITPVNVRQLCKRITKIARARWPEMCPPNRGWGGKRGNTKVKARNWNRREVAKV